MTVREAFSKAFGPVPDGATCHVAYCYFTELRVAPVYLHNCNVYTTVSTMMDDQVWQGMHFDGERVFGPDISDRLAESFRGFFGAEYDKMLEVQP